MGNLLCCQNNKENEEDLDNNIIIKKKELQNVMENLNNNKNKKESIKENIPHLGGKKPMSIIFETDEKKILCLRYLNEKCSSLIFPTKRYRMNFGKLWMKDLKCVIEHYNVDINVYLELQVMQLQFFGNMEHLQD